MCATGDHLCFLRSLYNSLTACSSPSMLAFCSTVVTQTCWDQIIADKAQTVVATVHELLWVQGLGIRSLLTWLKLLLQEYMSCFGFRV